MTFSSGLLGISWWLAAAGGADWMGKAAFIGAFVALIVLLASLPARMLGETERRPPLWRDVRAWARFISSRQVQKRNHPAD